MKFSLNHLRAGDAAPPNSCCGADYCGVLRHKARIVVALAFLLATRNGRSTIIQGIVQLRFPSKGSILPSVSIKILPLASLLVNHCFHAELPALKGVEARHIFDDLLVLVAPAAPHSRRQTRRTRG